MDALQITQILVILITLLVKEGNNSKVDDLVAPFTKCGQDNIKNKAGVRGATYFTTCSTLGGSKAKYCVFQCTSEKLGYIDTDKKQVTSESIKKIDDDMNGYLSEHKLKKVIANCAKDQIYDMKDKKCGTFKKFYYCCKNGLYAACNNYSGPPKFKSTNKDSSEETVGIVDVLDDDITLRKSLRKRSIY